MNEIGKVNLMQLGVVSISMSNIASVYEWAEKQYPELHTALAPIMEAEFLFRTLVCESFDEATQ